MVVDVYDIEVLGEEDVKKMKVLEGQKLLKVVKVNEKLVMVFERHVMEIRHIAYTDSDGFPGCWISSEIRGVENESSSIYESI